LLNQTASGKPGAVHIGPAATVCEGIELLEKKKVAAAILNTQLTDQDVMPLVMTFMVRAIPFVVCTVSPISEDLSALVPDLATVYKPAHPTAVLAALLQKASPDRLIFR